MKKYFALFLKKTLLKVWYYKIKPYLCIVIKKTKGYKIAKI